MGCTKIIYDLLPEKLFMGYGEEQLSRTLTFDISQMQAELPGGVPMIAYMRPRDELGYLASGVTLDGSTLTWELSAHVMQYKGIGGAQIVLVDESGEETHILKSHVMQMLIGSSIPLTGGEPPEPWETWLEQILAAAARAESAAADAEAQADRAETAEAGAQQALIDAGSPVLYGREQTLTDAQQQTARGNIAAASAADVSDLKSAIGNGFVTSAAYSGDLDNAPVGVLRYSHNNAHAPVNTVDGFVLTGFRTTGAKVQLATTDSGLLYARSYNSSSWAEWIQYAQTNELLDGFVTKTAYSGSLDAIDIGMRRYAYNCANSPDNTANGFVLTGFRTTGAKSQLAMTDAGNMYARSYNGTNWTSWTKFAQQSMVESIIQDLLSLSDRIGSISTGRNLYDHNARYDGYVVNPQGKFVENAAFRCSDWIAVEPSTTYALSNKYIQAYGFMSIAYYDSSKTFISPRITLTANMQTISTPSTCQYVRLNAQIATSDDKIMFVKGDSLPSKYLPYYKTYDNVRYSESVTNFDEFTNRKILGCPIPYYPIYRLSNGIAPPQSPSALHTAQIYALYDELVSSYPNYITKSSLGTASDGTTIYRYDFKPADTRYNVEHRQKAIVVSGTHGEPVGVYCLYQALKTICEQWHTNETLGMLRLNCHFIVVPVVNPYAIDHAGQYDGDVNLGRVNANGVNIARNFTCRWNQTPEGSNYSGTAPLSEPEAQAIESVLKANSDADWFTSFHNYGTPGYACWHTDGMTFMNQISNEHIKRMSASYYKSGLTPATGDYFGYSDMLMPDGSEGYEALYYGIRGGIFELCQSGNGETPWTSDAVTMGTELDINWMIMQYLAIDTPNNDW